MVGWCAVACLLTAGGMWCFTDNPEHNAVLSGFSRVGLVLAAVWLALPRPGEKVVWERLVPVVIGTLVFVALAGKAFQRLLPLAIVIVTLLYFLRPRPKRHARR